MNLRREMSAIDTLIDQFKDKPVDEFIEIVMKDSSYDAFLFIEAASIIKATIKSMYAQLMDDLKSFPESIDLTPQVVDALRDHNVSRIWFNGRSNPFPLNLNVSELKSWNSFPVCEISDVRIENAGGFSNIYHSKPYTIMNYIYDGSSNRLDARDELPEHVSAALLIYIMMKDRFSQYKLNVECFKFPDVSFLLYDSCIQISANLLPIIKFVETGNDRYGSKQIQIIRQ